MKITRRKFLEAAPVAAGAVMGLHGVGLASVLGDRVETAVNPLDQFGWDTFLPYIGTDFTFHDLRGREMTLRMVDMADSSPMARQKYSGSPMCFTMTFMGLADRRFVQRTYEVDHFALGKFDLFVTEAGKVKRNSVYLAVINRLVS